MEQRFAGGGFGRLLRPGGSRGGAGRSRRQEVQQVVEIGAFELGEARHAALAGADDRGNLLVGILVADAGHGRKRGQTAFAIGAVADGAALGVDGGAGVGRGLRSRRLAGGEKHNGRSRGLDGGNTGCKGSGQGNKSESSHSGAVLYVMAARM